jgi:hypothetical protein
MLHRRGVEGRIVESIERRPRLGGARVDVPRYMTGKGVGSIESYPAPYRDKQETCQTGVSAVDTGRKHHCRGIGVLVGEGAAEEGREAIS